MLKLTMDSPLAAELNALVLEKLNEYGWTDNEVLANFIVVMIANGKSKDDITTELAEILPEHSVDFATWLFDRMDAIANHNTAPALMQPEPQILPSELTQPVVQQQVAQEPPVDQISFDDVQDLSSMDEEKHEKRTQREARPSRLLQTAISSVSRDEPVSSRPAPSRKYDDYSSRHEPRRDREMRDRSMSPVRSSSRMDGGLTTRGLQEGREERIRFRRTSEERRQDQQRSIDERLGTPRDSGRRGGRSIEERLGSRNDSDSDNRRGRRGRHGTQEEADRNALRSIESRLGRRRKGNQDSDYFDGEDLPRHPKSWSKDPERMLLAEAELTRQSIVDHASKQVRCKYWPNCQSGEQCRFWHPKELCQAYPNCPNSADTCLYVHPLAEPTPEQLAAARRMRPNQPHDQGNGLEDSGANGDEKGLRALVALGSPSNGGFVGRTEDCKFGLACTRPGCMFRHPNRSNDMGQQQCRYYPNCTKPNCPFLHPAYGEALAAKDASMGDAKPAITRLPIPCRFGNNCTRPDCHFTHPRDAPSNSNVMDQDGGSGTNGTAGAAAGTNGAASQVLMPICKFNAGCTRPDCKFRHTVMRPLLHQQKVSTAERFGQGLIVDESQVEKLPVPASAHWATGGVSHQPLPPQQVPPQQQQMPSEQPVAPPAGVAVDASMEMDMDL